VVERCEAGGDRLISALEAERGGTRVSEGALEDWVAVARAISDRMRELGWNQRELASRSRVSVAVVREIQRNTIQRRRSPRTLESLSVALGWKPGHLYEILIGQGQLPSAGNATTIEAAAILSRIEALESRVDDIFKLVTELKADLATVIDHVRRK
jgi:transcriptional regulator with XRE-family HTH domain